jgi:diacylglycerol O-acyltransferase-1
MFLLMNYLILALKLLSYAHVLRNTRFVLPKIKMMLKQQSDKPITDLIDQNEISPGNFEVLKANLQTPQKLYDFKLLTYFMCAPTLCFQFEYPRNKSIRKIWLLRKLVEMLFSLGLQLYVRPSRPSSLN